MKGIELLKAAVEAGVLLLPKNFMEDNEINAKFLGYDGGGERVYRVDELDRVFYQKG